jgi:hypothetical protein
MNSRSRTLALVLAAQWAALLWAGALAADDAIPCERRLPRDVVAYVSFRNVAELRTQWALTETGKLTRDDALADLRGAVESKFAEFSKETEEEFGLGLNDLLNIPHGEVAAALAIQGDGKPAGVLLLDFGSQEEPVQKLLEKLAEYAKENGHERSEEDVEETRLVLYRAEAQEANQAPREVVGYFIKESFLVVGTSANSLKAVINRWDGKHENTLAENAVFRYIADKCRGESQDSAPLMNWFVDPLGIVKALIAAQPQANPQIGMVLTMLPLLGVDRFKGAGGSFDMVRGEFDMVSRTLIYLDPPVRGLLNMFQFDAGGQVPPKWVSSRVSSYFGINWNIAKAYSAAETLVDSLQGAGTFSRLIEQLAENEQAGGVHLKKDIIDQLTGKIHVVGESSGNEEDDEDKYLVAAEVKTAAGAKATLRKLAQVPGVQVKEREFQGESIYELESADEDDEDAVRMGVVVAENHMMFASDVKLLESVLRGADGTESLADSARYKRIARRFPEKTASIGFNHVDNPLKSIATLLNSPGFTRLDPDLANLASKLPSAEALKKYAASSGSFMEPDERGLKITSFSLKKDAE